MPTAVRLPSFFIPDQAPSLEAGRYSRWIVKAADLWLTQSSMPPPMSHAASTQSAPRFIDCARLPRPAGIGESPFVCEHFVLGKLEPFSSSRSKCPEEQAAQCDGAYDADDDVDHWLCTSLRPPSYKLRTYCVSRRRSSMLSLLCHPGIELPGIPCAITDDALSSVG